MKPDMKNALVFAHRANIDRYRRLAKTRPTVTERNFTGRRLDEEEEALPECVRRDARFDRRDLA